MNFESILESHVADEISDKIHPCNFFIGGDSMEIKGNTKIPSQYLLTLNQWLDDE